MWLKLYFLLLPSLTTNNLMTKSGLPIWIFRKIKYINSTSASTSTSAIILSFIFFLSVRLRTSPIQFHHIILAIS